MYHVAIDNQDSVQRLRQPAGRSVDDGAEQRAAPATSARTSTFRRSARHVALGGRRRERLGDARPVDTNLVWSSASGSGSVGGIVTRYDVRDAASRDGRGLARWRRSARPADSLKYRFVWTFPLTHLAARSQRALRRQPARARHDRRRADLAGDHRPISRATTSRGSRLRAASRRTTSASSTAAWCSRSPSRPRRKALSGPARNDGLVQVTRDGGKTWTNVTANIPSLPPGGR